MSKTRLVEGEDFYYNEQGFRVFTEKYHLREDFVAKMVANIVRMVMIKIPIHLEKKYQNNEKMLDFGTFSGISGDFV